jgi:hypothetical protein
LRAVPSINTSIVTFALGATVSNRDGTIDLKAISSIAAQFRDLLVNHNTSKRRRKEKILQIVALVGAGGLGRDYKEFARKQIGKTAELDLIAIKASQVNAFLLASVLQKFSVVTNAKIPGTIDEVNDYLSLGFDCVVLGGLEAKMTSDSTAAMIAQQKNGPLVIVSTKGGILANSGAGAILLPKVDRSYVRKLLNSNKVENHVLDKETCRILLDKKKGKGMNVLVTGYPKISSATNSLLKIGSKPSTMLIDGATRIFL